ncbi:MAG: nucleotidyltransferase family protein [Geitlerinemataceae cyanobacterium]
MPPTREATLATLQRERPTLQALGARSLSLFGSVARDRATPDSDIDLLVELEEHCTLFHLFRLRRHLEAQLDRPIDLGTIDALRDRARDPILNEAIRVF